MFAELNPWATKGREKLPKDRQNRKAAVPNRSVRTVQNKQNHQLQIPQFRAKNTYDTCTCDWCHMGWARRTSTRWAQIRLFFLFTLRLSLSVQRINLPYSLGVQISAWLLRKKEDWKLGSLYVAVPGLSAIWGQTWLLILELITPTLTISAAPRIPIPEREWAEEAM